MYSSRRNRKCEGSQFSKRPREYRGEHTGSVDDPEGKQNSHKPTEQTAAR